MCTSLFCKYYSVTVIVFFTVWNIPHKITIIYKPRCVYVLVWKCKQASPASLRTEPLSRIFWGFKSRCEMFRSWRNWRAQAVQTHTHTHNTTQSQQKSGVHGCREYPKCNLRIRTKKENVSVNRVYSCLEMTHQSAAGSVEPPSRAKSYDCEWSERDLHQNTIPGSDKYSQHPTDERKIKSGT